MLRNTIGQDLKLPEILIFEIYPMRKSHLYFHNPVEGVTTLRQKKRFPSNTNNEENEVIDPDVYTPHKEEFLRSRDSFISDLRVRRENRNPSLKYSSKY